MENNIEELRSRLRNVILNTCNKLGCDNCDLKWLEEDKQEGKKQTCQSDYLQNKIDDIEINNK